MLEQSNDPDARMLAGKTGAGDERNKAKREPCPSGHSIGSAYDVRDDFSSETDACSRTPARQQRLNALNGANVVRIERARYRKRLKEGSLEFDSFLDEMPECCANVSIVKLVQWMPNIGLTKARKIVAELPIEEGDGDVRLGELSPKALYQLSAHVERQVAVYRSSSFAATA